MRIAIRSPLRAFLVLGGLTGALTLVPEQGAAQSSVTITGQVTNPQGEPLRDANVSIFDLSIGVWTGPDGAYRLIVPGARADGKQVKLGARLIGYRMQSFGVTLTPGATLAQDFQLVSDPLRLDEIVVTGAGTEQLRERLGSNVSSVTAAEVQRANESNVVQALAGKVPNVLTNQASGDAGASTAILIRGPKSFGTTPTGFSPSPPQPVIIVDGVPLRNVTHGEAVLSGAPSPNRAADINTEDIESIEILPGAASTSIYGASAGSAGAILITTKRGRPGQTTYSLRSSLQFDEPVGTLPVQRKYGVGSGGVSSNCTTVNCQINSNFFSWGPELDPATPTYDHGAEMFETGHAIENTLTLSGGSERTTFYLSAGQLDQNGFIVGDNDTWRPLGWLQLNWTLGGDYTSDDRTYAYAQASSGTNGGQMERWQFYDRLFDHLLTATGTHEFNRHVRGGLTVGQNLNETYYRQIDVLGQVWLAPKPFKLQNTTTRTLPNDAEQRRRVEGYFAQANVDLYDQLFLQGCIRNDANSAFGVGHQRAWYPGGSAAWSFAKAVHLPEQIVSFGKLRLAYGESGQQPPLYATQDVFTTTRFIDFNPGSLQGTTINGVGGLYASATRGNPDIKPERVREVEGGVDLGLFRGRADLSVTRYDSKSKDVVFGVDLVPSTGYTTMNINAGELTNKGWELTSNIHVLQQRDLSIDIGANWARNRNMVTSLGATASQLAGDVPMATPENCGPEAKVPRCQIGIGSSFSGQTTHAQIGYPLGVWRSTDFARCGRGLGLVSFSGATYDVGSACAGAPDGALYIAANGFPITDPSVRAIGNPWPDWTAGISLTATYRGVQLSAFLEHRQGGDGLSRRIGASTGSTPRWTAPGLCRSRSITKRTRGTAMNTYSRAGAVLALTLLGAGCSDFLQGPGLTENPNNPSTGTALQQLVSVQANMATRLEGQLARCAGVYTQQLIGSNNQQLTYCTQYAVTEADISGQMNGFYTGGGLLALRNIQAAAQASGDNFLLGIAKVWEGLAMGTATSVWGDLPYSEAVDPTIAEPVLDPQESIYAAVQSRLDEGIAALQAALPGASGNCVPAEGDLIYCATSIPPIPR